MSMKSYRVLAVVAAACALAAAVVALVMGGCNSCAVGTSETCVPMKCHYAFQAVALVEVMGAFCAAGLFLVKCKIGRRWLACGGVLAQMLCAILVYTPYVGICASAGMACHTTALVCVVLGTCVVVVCAALFAAADPKRAAMPKRGL